jgi:uncharacterized protein
LPRCVIPAYRRGSLRLASLAPIVSLWADPSRKPRAMNGVVDNPGKHRFELPLENEAAVAYYQVADDGKIELTHTEVPSHLKGQGIGSKLAQGVFEILRARGAKVAVRCPFMTAYVDRHPEYAQLLND